MDVLLDSATQLNFKAYVSECHCMASNHVGNQEFRCHSKLSNVLPRSPTALLPEVELGGACSGKRPFPFGICHDDDGNDIHCFGYCFLCSNLSLCDVVNVFPATPSKWASSQLHLPPSDLISSIPPSLSPGHV